MIQMHPTTLPRVKALFNIKAPCITKGSQTEREAYNQLKITLMLLEIKRMLHEPNRLLILLDHRDRGSKYLA